MTAREQAKKTLFCLFEATRIGEPVEVEITIIENALKEYGSSKVAEMPTDECIEAEVIISNLMAYGRIHTVKRVFYTAGTHEEFIERAEVWLSKFRNRMSKPNTGGEG